MFDLMKTLPPSQQTPQVTQVNLARVLKIMKIIFYELVFLQSFYRWVLSGWISDFLYYFENIK